MRVNGSLHSADLGAYNEQKVMTWGGNATNRVMTWGGGIAPTVRDADIPNTVTEINSTWRLRTRISGHGGEDGSTATHCYFMHAMGCEAIHAH